jgi:hypothetical protein
LFGLFKKKSDDSPLRKHAERAANKRAQPLDRWESIDALCKAGSPEAVAGLLPRFTFYVDPSITDQEEKDMAFDGIVKAGQGALEPVVAFLRKAESISWPVKMLDRLVSNEQVVGYLVELLDAMDIEYERDPQRKIQVLATLEERRDPRAARAAARFLADASEPVRFNAAGAVLAQAEASEQQGALIDCVCAEESVRVRNRILDGFVAQKWRVEARREELTKRLPAGYSLDASGTVHKR